MSAFKIRQAGEEDISALYDLYQQCGKQDEGYFEVCFEKDCLILMIAQEQGEEERDIGFGLLNFEPKYGLYQKLEIPEIQDLNVIPEARRQGAGAALVEAFENMARDQGAEQIGISVGLTKDYGPAQRLYIKRGYVPDGQGVTFDRQAVESGQRYLLGDDLCLMMIKEL